jgi:hypothetical protein
MGQEDRFSRRRLSGRSWFSQQTFAETRGNGQDAPKAVSRMMLSNRTRQVLDTALGPRSNEDGGRATAFHGGETHYCQLIRRKADISGEAGLERCASLAPSLVVFEPDLYAGMPSAEPMDATHACGTLA